MNAILEVRRTEVPEPLEEPSPQPGSHRVKEFVLEIGTEEIPALMMPAAMAGLQDNFANALRDARLEHDAIRTFGTPRRLILYCPAVAERQSDRVDLILGPSRKVAFDPGGATRALEGFLRKNQARPEQVEIVSTPKGEYVALRQQVQGRPAAEVLAELLPRLVLSIPFPKSMVWTPGQERFVRPIHYLLALLGGEVVPFDLAGVRSGRRTAGHSILAPRTIEVHSFAELREKLASHYVLIDPEERRRLIARGLESTPPRSMRALPDADLLDEVVHLVEYPGVLLGDFDARFLDLPAEVLVTVLRKHQKYFAVVDGAGKIQPCFLTVLNTAVTAPDGIRRGHSRVLRARLEDALFYREFDGRRALADRVPLLAQVLFQQNLGSYQDKLGRLDKLALYLAAETGLEKTEDLQTAVRLCKTDLTTEMVKEFTELQGVVGGLYARDQGYPEAVWKAIYQHYQPISQEGPIPDSPTGRLLSIADKLDTLCGSFGIGIVPTGSSDPFSLRRQCRGIVRIAVEGGLSFSLRGLFAVALSLLKASIKRSEDEIFRDLFDFFNARVRHFFAELGMQYDVINAVLETGYDDLTDLHRRARAVQAMRVEPDFEAITTSFKRINNILAGQAPDDGKVDDTLLLEAAEQELHQQFTRLQPAIHRNMERRDYYDALKIMAGMRPQLDRFFDKVLVMAQDPKLRRNRLCLLREISLLFRQVGDLSLIVLQ
ncbi:MAG: glycine--tRNA ligase subunit beta [Acidobacteria bacterium]|nr:glycine--tRNA ligase subunit beta [Acidobacteriota bacterium]